MARANLRLRALTGTPWIIGQSVLRLAPEVTVLPWQDRAHGELLQGVDVVKSPVLLAWLNLRPMDEAAHLSRAVAAVEAVDPPQALSLLLRLARGRGDQE